MEQRLIFELTFKKLIMDSYRREMLYYIFHFILMAISTLFAIWMAIIGNEEGILAGLFSLLVFTVVYFFKYTTNAYKPKRLKEQRLVALKNYLKEPTDGELNCLRNHWYSKQYFV